MPVLTKNRPRWLLPSEPTIYAPAVAPHARATRECDIDFVLLLSGMFER